MVNEINMESSGKFSRSDNLDLDKTSDKINMIDLELVILNIILFIAMVFFNAASTVPIEGLFKFTGAQISNRSEVDITPAGWTFSTWGAIYILQGMRCFFDFGFCNKKIKFK